MCIWFRYLCGVKANYETVGVNAKVKLGDCQAASDPSTHVQSLAVLAQKAGKATGVVTTTRVTHASPSGNYAHTAHRDYESDTDAMNLAKEPKYCRDIATQLVEDSTGQNLNVIFGGGRTKFIPKTEVDEYNSPGNRSDGINLINRWKELHPEGRYISNRDQLLSLKPNDTNKVLGLFAHSHMDYNLDTDHRLQPTLREMAMKAVDILSQNEKGYFLFIEGGRIDQAHHEAKAKKALDETLQFAQAIKEVVDRTKREDTLIVVTSDHSHTMSINGYPYRGNPIFGYGHDKSEFGMFYSCNLKYLFAIMVVPVFFSLRWHAVHDIVVCQRSWHQP